MLPEEEDTRESNPMSGTCDGCAFPLRKEDCVDFYFDGLTPVFFTITQSWQCWHYCQLCVPTYLQFSSLFTPTVVNKHEIRNQWVHEDY